MGVAEVLQARGPRGDIACKSPLTKREQSAYDVLIHDLLR